MKAYSVIIFVVHVDTIMLILGLNLKRNIFDFGYGINYKCEGYFHIHLIDFM